MRRSSSAPVSRCGSPPRIRSSASSPTCRSDRCRAVGPANRGPDSLSQRERGLHVSITSTLIVQMIVFLILIGFTMKFIWPPITAALDARAQKVAEGLSAADKAKAELAVANQRVEQQLSEARNDAAKRLADAERLAHQMIEEAKGRAA